MRTQKTSFSHIEYLFHFTCIHVIFSKLRSPSVPPANRSGISFTPGYASMEARVNLNRSAYTLLSCRSHEYLLRRIVWLLTPCWSLQSHGIIPVEEVDMMTRKSIACPAFPLCGLAQVSFHVRSTVREFCRHASFFCREKYILQCCGCNILSDEK